jgi:predicted nucleic acid-binding protein
MIIADTGFFFALGNRQDKFHQKAKQCLQRLEEPIITTYPVIIETSYLLAERCNQSIQFKFLEQFIQGRVNIFSLEIHHLERCLGLMKQYADLPMDLADASLVVVAEELDETRILTTDQRDFSIYRFHTVKVGCIPLKIIH